MGEMTGTAIVNYVRTELGGGMLAQIGLTRLKLLVGQNIVDDIDNFDSNEFLKNNLIRAAEIVLNRTLPPDVVNPESSPSTTNSQSSI